jgi:hypothetical protein
VPPKGESTPPPPPHNTTRTRQDDNRPGKGKVCETGENKNIVEGYKREEEYSFERSERNMMQEICKKRVHKNRNGRGRIHELSVKRTKSYETI